jgi:aminoglycoside 3-N-acetyltransferase
MARSSRTVSKFCRTVLPLIQKKTRGSRILDDVAAIQATDRWNSFDRFHETTDTLVRRYEESGAGAEVYRMQTGGKIGSGRWIIHEAADVISATVDIIQPFRQRVLDYKENPWHVIQWGGSTPRNGLTNDLVVVDSEAELNGFGPGRLNGKMVLTKLEPRGLLRALAEAGAVGVITDRKIANLPNATAWSKFGWGGVPIDNSAFHLVGLVLSHNEGKRLRTQLKKHGSLRLRTRVDIRKYVGTHDLVSGLIRGTGDPQDEVWALAHSAEPGAIDNASGVAMCVEIARVIEGLIAEGALPRPRRTIRLLNAYECHGFFKYLEDVRRLQTPLAGVVIDTIGSKPSVCDGRLEWHATIPMSAGFVDRLGASIIRSALRNQNPGYRLCQEPFMPTSDTLIGDPKFGFPCPWITTHHRDTGKGFDAYHTSADQIGLLSGKGLAVCAASMASYLYWLADAGTPEVVDIARVETERSVDRLTARGMTRNQLHFECEQHSTIIEELKRWMWGGNRENTLSILDACRSEVLQTSENRSRRRKPSRQKGKEVDTRIPRRTAILSPISENVSGDISWRIGRSGLSSWALFWADGKRSLTDIAAALSCETGKTVPVRQVAEYFEAHEALDYVRLINRKDMVSRVKLIADLKALGLISGMDVMVHSSLAKIGHVIGGADSVVDALLNVIGKRGTLVMPSFNHRGAQVYNAQTTPTTNGAIPDRFWRRAGVVRSDHPTHAVSAYGPKALEICSDHTLKGLWTENSPIGQLVHGGGYILSLGVDHNATTAYHVAELSVPCGCILPKGSVDRVVSEDGQVVEVPGLAFRSRICPVSPTELNHTLEQKGLQAAGMVGEAKSTLAKAGEVWKARRRHLADVCPTCTIEPRITRQH